MPLPLPTGGRVVAKNDSGGASTAISVAAPRLPDYFKLPPDLASDAGHR